MNKINIFVSGLLVALALVFIVLFGVKEISGMRHVEVVSTEEVLPEFDHTHPILLSSEGYVTDDENFRIISGELYLRLDYVNANYTGERLFFDDQNSQVIYTTGSQVENCAINTSYDLRTGQMHPDGVSTFVVRYTDGETEEEDKNKELYVSARALSNLYGIQFHYSPGTHVLIHEEEMMRYVTVKASDEPVYLKANAEDNSLLREIIGKNEGSKVFHELTAGDELVCYGEVGNYYKAADSEGVLGYVDKNAVGEIEYSQREAIQQQTFTMDEAYQLDDRISVIWEYFGVNNSWFANNIVEEYEGTQGALTVIAPTWLHVWRDYEGGEPYIQNSISTEYLEWAHESGYKVWVTLENVDNYFEDIGDMQYTLFSDTETRQGIVQQMLEWYQEYHFDGINIDLEEIEPRLGPYFVQFMRELSAVLRPAGCMVTTDLGVPTAWNTYYRHDVMGEICDYVCLMAYDEHYATDTTAGSVASFPWVQGGVQDSLTQGIPPEKLVLCMPLYTRIWYLDSSGAAIPEMTRTVDYTDAWSEVTLDRGIEPSWDQTCAQYYADWSTDGLRVRTWLEDTTSMQRRIDLAVNEKLGGVALWSKGRDTQEMWDLVRNYLQEQE